MKNETHITHSRFWLSDQDIESITQSEKMDVFRLAAYRRAIANFVFILTRKQIPVRFQEKAQSFTDKKSICIGGELSKGEFDSTVGLALHEAAHIIHDGYFVLSKLMWIRLPGFVYDAGKGKLSKHSICTFTNEVHNWVEDRFIDDYVKRIAPGYTGYYTALYEKYFFNNTITSALKSQSYRDKTLYSYRIRLINLINPNSDLDALPRLREIWEMLDLDNINRLKLPEDRYQLALSISQMILEEITDNEKDPPASSEKSSTSGSGSAEKNDLIGESESSEKEKVAFDKQRSFVNGTVEKSGLESDIIERLDIFEESNMDLAVVGGTDSIPKLDCVVVKKMTFRLMESGYFPYCETTVTANSHSIAKNDDADAGVTEGIDMGKMLGRKLQIRREARHTITPREKMGKLDNRLLAELGFGNDAIFYTTHTDKYKKAHLHLTVDASGSMQHKWKETIKLTTALAKAVSMVDNLSIVISFRSGVEMEGKTVPYIVIAYDSRVEKFSKVEQTFRFLSSHGCTPEGLTFQAIVKEIPRSTDELTCYFLNISDGEPCFTGLSIEGKSFNYANEPATRHTRRQIQQLRSAGIDVLSYYIGSSLLGGSKRETDNQDAFRQMYGSDSKMIDVSSVTQIAKTMNDKFLEKDGSD